MSREDIERLVAERTQQIYKEVNRDRLLGAVNNLAESPKEAELMMLTIQNRIFPEGMSAEDIALETHAIVTAKRTQAKAVELARKVQSSANASRNTATTQRDPQASPAPGMAPDLAASMQRAGYTYNGQLKRYEKTLPNGKILVKESGKPPYLAN
jgi:hypothetical protein